MTFTSGKLLKVIGVVPVLTTIAVSSAFAETPTMITESHSAPIIVPQPNPTPVIVPAPSDSSSNYVSAKIISVEPSYVTKKVPYTKCHYEQRAFAYQSRRAVDGSGTVIGGIAGGVIGNQIGRGNGNIAATIGGTIVGALAGNQVERDINRPDVYVRMVEVCRTHYTTKQIINGYHVTYQYNGHIQTKFMKKKPVGKELRLTLTPVV